MAVLALGIRKRHERIVVCALWVCSCMFYMLMHADLHVLFYLYLKKLYVPVIKIAIKLLLE